MMEVFVLCVSNVMKCALFEFVLPCHFSSHIQDYTLPFLLMVMPDSCCSISASTDKS